jgi:acyl-CoA synthetase (AMP-forming)/AMP-acid ligase II
MGSVEFAARVAADVNRNWLWAMRCCWSNCPVSESSHGPLASDLAHPELLGNCPGDCLSFEDWPASARRRSGAKGLSRQTPLEILFTSGTTGDPKGMVLTHGNVLASVGPIEQGAQPYMRWERLVHPLRILHTLPLSHVFGQTMGLWVPPIFTAELHFEEPAGGAAD